MRFGESWPGRLFTISATLQWANEGTHLDAWPKRPDDVALDTAEKLRVALFTDSRAHVEPARRSGVARSGADAARRRRHCWPDMGRRLANGEGAGRWKWGGDGCVEGIDRLRLSSGESSPTGPTQPCTKPSRPMSQVQHRPRRLHLHRQRAPAIATPQPLRRPRNPPHAFPPSGPPSP
jgi:hypothetical protein